MKNSLKILFIFSLFLTSNNAFAKAVAAAPIVEDESPQEEFLRRCLENPLACFNNAQLPAACGTALGAASVYCSGNNSQSRECQSIYISVVTFCGGSRVSLR